MEQFEIVGGNKLCGTVNISGSKNAVLPLISAAIIPDKPIMLTNVPDVKDVEYIVEAIRGIGASVSKPESGVLVIDGSTINKTEISYTDIKNIRASYYLAGALLAKYGSATVPMPGGCDLGNRPIDQHLKGFKKLGASVNIENGVLKTKTKNSNLIGKTIFLDIVSVGATINIMLAASMAKGVTTIINAAREPHVVDVANFLHEIGVRVSGAGTDRIRVIGTSEFNSTTHKVIPDQIEAATFMIAAAATGGDVNITGPEPSTMQSVIAKLTEAGCDVSINDGVINVNGPDRLSPISVITNPHPSFPTDAQPLITAALTTAIEKSSSVVTENIFSARYMYIQELLKMGADIEVHENVAVINGVERLSGAIVEAPDLRAGAALIIAGLMACGTTRVRNIEYIRRGYSNIENKLTELGADIKLSKY